MIELKKITWTEMQYSSVEGRIAEKYLIARINWQGGAKPWRVFVVVFTRMWAANCTSLELAKELAEETVLQLLGDVLKDEKDRVCEHVLGYRTENEKRVCQTCGEPWESVNAV